MARKVIGMSGWIADYTVGTAIVLAQMLLQGNELRQSYRWR